MESKNRKKVVVFFSGGLDSTYLVWKNLTDGNVVYPIYVNIGNNKDKATVEQNRTKLLWDMFYEDFKLNDINYSFQLHTRVTNIFTIDVDAREDSLMFKQMPVWLLAAIYAQGFDADEIQIGYVMNDDAISYLKDIKNIYNSYQAICDKTLIPIKFPLKKMQKRQMARDLPQRYKKYIISCENPKIIESTRKSDFIEYTPCCLCVPCNHIIASGYYNTESFPDNYKTQLIKLKKKELADLDYVFYDQNGRVKNSYFLWDDEGDAVVESLIPNGFQFSLDLWGTNPIPYDGPPDSPPQDESSEDCEDISPRKEIGLCKAISKG